ncbi:hypothetical protein Dsin_018475 [Dipteronia sinensis]|uniref:Reverse transcriptase zinc-binding domain-containing protein n=1 Tax=Dipteronia sinensis TaxID=43782 RepID=A0AAE0A683_9ROSI|nr:hypothetical protein Dsin_018475 [Dipteronia sinensis]
MAARRGKFMRWTRIVYVKAREMGVWELRRVLYAKYGIPRDKLLWNWDDIRLGSSFVKAIGSLFAVGSITERVLKEGMTVLVGNGRRADFWSDPCGFDLPLKVLCPRIFAIASNKSGRVVDYGRWQDSVWKWEVQLRRPLFGWEQDQWKVFLSILECFRICHTNPDVLAWSYCLDGKFSVSSLRRCLEDANSEPCHDHSFIWKGLCPSKVEMFIWQLIKGRVLGLNSNCRFCNSEIESIDHLFLHCDWTWELWSRCMAWLGVWCCCNKSLVGWAHGWTRLCPRKKYDRAWNSLFCAITWTVWEVRNNLLFKGKQVSISLATDLVKFREAWWFKHHERGSKEPITYILLNLKECCSESKPRKSIKADIWYPSSSGAYKFNVDGSSKGNPGSAGIEGALRDLSRKIMGLFSVNVGIMDAISAEIFAIHKACFLCANTPVIRGKQISIIIDSKKVVSWIYDDGVGNLNHVNYIYDIRSFLSCFANTKVVFNPRTSNYLADNLTKKGSRMEVGASGAVLLAFADFLAIKVSSMSLAYQFVPALLVFVFGFCLVLFSSRLV